MLHSPRRAALLQTITVLQWLMGATLLAAFGWLWLRLVQPNGWDYVHAFRPAIDLLLRGQSPYLADGFYNPPWALLPLLPLQFLPAEWGATLLALLIPAVFGVVAWRLGAKPLPLALYVFNPQTFRLALNGQIDGLLLIGLLLPRPVALFFVLAKPQLGIGLAVYWLVDSWRVGGWRRVLRDFGPVGAAFALSFAVYGFYLSGGQALGAVPWNASIWPYGLMVGAGLLASALRGRRWGRALVAGPFFSPYVAANSIVTPMIGLVDDQWVMAAVCLALWPVYILSK